MLPKYMTRSVKRNGIIENINPDRKLTQKQRRYDNDSSPPKKLVKIESSEESAMIRITDINDDCLAHIFSFLELVDLLNVADTSNMLLSVACTAYARKYGKKYVSVGIFNQRKMELEFEIDEELIRVNSFSNRLKVLRCFGSVIFKLEIQYWVKRREQDHQALLDYYISKYCVASAIKINGDLMKATMPNLSKCFPNVQHLQLKECCTAYLSHNEVYLPHLDHLTICNSEEGFKNITNFIYSNPQLKSLRLPCNVDFNLLRFISEHLKDLKSLDFIIDKCTDSDTKDTIQFKNVKKLRFGFFCHFKMPNISLSFDQLEEFAFNPPYAYFTNASSLIDFISKHPRITKFKHPSSKNPSCLGLIFAKRVAKLLPSLKEFDLGGISFTSDEVIDLLKQNPHLKSLQFKLLGEYDVLQKLLGDDWRSTIDKDRLVKLEQ